MEQDKDKIRIYVLNVEEVDLKEEHVATMADERFCELALEAGSVYDLVGFQHAFNHDLINSSNSFIRIF